MVHDKTLKKMTTSFVMLILISLFWTVGIQPAVAGQVEIEIISFKGVVEIRRGQSVSWMKAEKGFPLEYGDVVRTGPQSIAVIRHASAKIQLYENTLLEFPSHRTGRRVSDKSKGFTSIFMQKGHSLIKVFKNRLKRRFEIVTPSLIAGVKGTTFKVYEEADIKGVAVIEGIVEVINRNDLNEVIELTEDHFTMIQDKHLTMAMELDDDHVMISEKEYLNTPETLSEVNRVSLESQTNHVGPDMNEQVKDLDEDLDEDFNDDFNDEPKELTTELRDERDDLDDDLRNESKEFIAELRDERDELEDDLQDESKELIAALQDERDQLQDDLRDESKELIAELRDERDQLRDDLREESNDLVAELRDESDLKDEGEELVAGLSNRQDELIETADEQEDDLD